MPALAHCAPRAGDDETVAGSFRDPSGFLFTRGGELLRQVNPCYHDDYERLMRSGLYDELTAAGLLVEHEEVDEPAWSLTEADRVLRPVRVPLVTYPYEWCFSQLRDAALATLKIQRRAMARGMWLKDASAYNIQWRGGRPVLIDTLSFERYPEGGPWPAYGQFCRHFLAPLALMQYGDARLGRLSQLHLDGVPLDLAAGLLPRRTKWTLGLGLHVHAHARVLRKHARLTPQQGRAAGRKLSPRSLGFLLQSLESAVSKLKPPREKTPWEDYYDSMHNYGKALAAKERLVTAFLAAARPKTVWDLGANDGRFSRLAAKQGAQTAAWDLDFSCVERNYREVRDRGETNVLPLLLDLTNPSPAVGWNHRERMSLAERGPCDVALALGVVHHLAIGNNVPLPRVAGFLAGICRSLIVEFVPKQDSQVQRLLASREDIFPGYEQSAFESAFARRFRLAAIEPIPGTRRTVYFMEEIAR